MNLKFLMYLNKFNYVKYCFISDRICYDDACHLKKYCANPKRKCLTTVTERLGNMDMVIDKMHFRNHVDPWCRLNCNPYDRADLDGVSSN